ncbi:hypothetical protein Tco_1290053, partial [Tanacetum coccineum]
MVKGFLCVDRRCAAFENGTSESFDKLRRQNHTKYKEEVRVTKGETKCPEPSANSLKSIQAEGSILKRLI